MNTNTCYKLLYGPLGKVQFKHSYIRYHIERDVQWQVINYDKDDEDWFGQRASERGIKEFPLEEREIEEFKSAIEKQAVIEEKRMQPYRQINKPLANANYVDFPQKIAMEVLQHGYGITTAKSRMPILGTRNAGPCIILALYDDKKKIAALAHLGGTEEVDSVENIIKSFEVESTVAHMHGGTDSTLCNGLDLIDLIRRHGIKIESCALIEHSNGNTSLAIDARNGRLYALLKPNALTYQEDGRAILDQVIWNVCHIGPTPINKGYDGLIDLLDGSEETVDIPKSQPLPPGWEKSELLLNISLGMCWKLRPLEYSIELLDGILEQEFYMGLPLGLRHWVFYLLIWFIFTVQFFVLQELMKFYLEK